MQIHVCNKTFSFIQPPGYRTAYGITTAAADYCFQLFVIVQINKVLGVQSDHQSETKESSMCLSDK